MRGFASYVVLLLIAPTSLSLPNEQQVAVAPYSLKCTHSVAGGADARARYRESYEDRRIAGLTALYNLDFNAARTNFQWMAETAPERPQSYVYLASTLLVETLNKSRRLSSALYAGGAFYTPGSSTDAADPEAGRQFNGFIDKALAICSDLLKRNQQDVDALYYEASALGLRAAYIAMVERNFRKAFDDANNSVNIDKKVLKLDPSRSDAYLYIGLYEYVIGCLPFLWRLLARFAGLPGSRDGGIQDLENVVARGKDASDDARVLLIPIYYREGKPDRALVHAEALAAKYPQNYLIKSERAAMLYACWRASDGYFAFKQLLDQPRVAAEARDIVSYRWAEARQGARDLGGALEAYKQVIGWPESHYDLVTQAHLHAGEMLDSLGRRDEATAEYQIVLQRRDVYDCQNQARDHSKHPFRAK